MAAWSSEEDIIILYFSSRHIRCTTTVELLNRRGYTRSAAAVYSRLATLQKWHPQLKFKREFNIHSINSFLYTLLPPNDVKMLILLTPEDASIICQSHDRAQFIEILILLGQSAKILKGARP
ncbi:hypothetical protein I7I53_07005 [Histoplasma capsulatum var. duboisii H88]|uniref:Uncharacterized protein n=1 Tax=Ajellomyces capsulatus (strain H88) TaxID=544711 RepID=A0A8A1LIM5_AJEC8|nr:hypothetical protein I7I53_07005 [Histoplasma capsulatum var. duboisii H88]